MDDIVEKVAEKIVAVDANFCVRSWDKPDIYDYWKSASFSTKERFRNIARAAITALANAPLDKSGLDAAASAYLTAQHRAMTEATGENPVEAAIRAYLTAIKEATCRT